MKTKADDYQTIAMSVARTTLVWNVVLSLLKLIAGLVAHSVAMVSDAVHSASDVLSTIVVMIGVKISGKKADKDHPYGHERLECVAAMILAGMLAAVGVGIGYGAIRSIIEFDATDFMEPGLLALAGAVVSIAVKEGMFRYTIRHAKKINSPALTADAWHHRSDALSSIGALIGIAGARMGWLILDPLASIVICGFILKAAWDIFVDAVNKTVDHACDPQVQRKIRESARSVSGVAGIDSMKTREFGARIYVDLEIRVDGNLTLDEAHKIAETVHRKLETDFPEIKHCMVHENPA